MDEVVRCRESTIESTFLRSMRSRRSLYLQFGDEFVRIYSFEYKKSGFYMIPSSCKYAPTNDHVSYHSDGDGTYFIHHSNRRAFKRERTPLDSFVGPESLSSIYCNHSAHVVQYYNAKKTVRAQDFVIEATPLMYIEIILSVAPFLLEAREAREECRYLQGQVGPLYVTIEYVPLESHTLLPMRFEQSVWVTRKNTWIWSDTEGWV